MAPSRAAKLLLEVEDSTPRARVLDIARQLIRLGSEAVPDLLEAARSSATGGRSGTVAVYALGKIVEPVEETVPAVVVALSTGDRKTRRYAASALGEIGSALALTALRRAVADETWEVGMASLKALVKVGDASGEPVFSSVVSALQNGAWQVRCLAVESLASGSASSDEVIPHLIAALDDEVDTVCWTATFALTHRGSEAVPSLLKLLEHKDERLRLAAATALQAMPESADRAIPALARALNDGRPTVRRAAASALGRMGPQSLAELVEAFHEDRGQCQSRVLAAHAIGRLGALASCVALELVESLRDADADLREAAAAALGEVGRPTEVVVAALDRALNDDTSAVRRSAEGALAKLAPLAKRAISSVETRAGTGKTVPALLGELDDEDENTRYLAAFALGEIGSRSEPAVARLTDMLSNETKYTRAAAADALGKIGPAAVPYLRRLVDQSAATSADVQATVAYALGHVGREAVPLLVELLAHESDAVRSCAAYGLGRIGPDARAAVGALAERLGSCGDDKTACAFAADALGKIGRPTSAAVTALRTLSTSDDFEIAQACGKALERLEGDDGEALGELDRTVPGWFSVVVAGSFIVVGEEPREIVESHVDKIVKKYVSLLEQDYFGHGLDAPVTVWLLKSAESFKRYSQIVLGVTTESRFGYYSPETRTIVLNVASGLGTLVHEMVHPFMHASFASCPPWFNEGLASLYERCGVRDGSIYGYSNWRLPGLKKLIHDGTLTTIGDLTSMNDGQFYEMNASGNYAQARYLCFYLQEMGLLKRFFRELQVHESEDPTGFETLLWIVGERDIQTFEQKWKGFVFAVGT